jgi:hypothetical protein
MKGRYFPDSDFLSAGKPRDASFTWCSILFGCDLLLKGLMWGIRNGEHVNILKDLWVPGLPKGSFTPLTPLPPDAKVSFLMDSSSSAWDSDMLAHFFLASSISKIPINKFGGEDFVTWPLDKSGIYTIRSAYNLVRTETFYAKRTAAGQGMSSDHDSKTRNWKALWAIQAPGKMKIVL